MMYYDRENVLIVVGGRADRKDLSVLDDIHMLRMDNLTWIQVIGGGKGKIDPRSSFSMSFVDDRLVIFGGMKEDF